MFTPGENGAGQGRVICPGPETTMAWSPRHREIFPVTLSVSGCAGRNLTPVKKPFTVDVSPAGRVVTLCLPTGGKGE